MSELPEKAPLDAHDERVFPYCRMLGGPAPFRYCRTQGGEALCPSIITCWQGRFDVARFLLQHYDADFLRQLVSRAREDKAPKLARLIEEAGERRPRAGDQGD